jgi:hypothetical protein
MDDHPFASQCTIQKRELAHDIMGNPMRWGNGDQLLEVEEEKFLPGSGYPSRKHPATEAETDFEKCLFAKTCLSCIFPLYHVYLFYGELLTTCH